MATTKIRPKRKTSASNDDEPTIKSRPPIKKKATPPRTRPRIEDTESKSNTIKDARGTRNVGGIINLVDGELFISAQLSELVPVAQFANVAVGPVQMQWKVPGVDMESLITVDWEAEEIEMTLQQNAAYERALGALTASTRVLFDLIGNERAMVEESVRMHNQRKEEAEKVASKKVRK